jgi:enediyne biosynthesis protein E5
MKKLSLKLQLAVFLFLFLALIAFQERSTAVLWNGVLALVASVLADAVWGFVRSRKFKFSESALVTGLLIGFVLSADGPWWSYPAAAIIAIVSKQLIRIKGKHIFNPAGFGSFLAVILFGNTTQWYGAYIWYLIIPFGLYFVYRIKRLPIVAAFYLTAVVLYGGQALLQKTSFLDPIIYLNHFFIFIMLIEPKTSPFDKLGAVLFGALASGLCFILSFVTLPFSGELPVLLTMNLLNISYQNIKGGKR